MFSGQLTTPDTFSYHTGRAVPRRCYFVFCANASMVGRSNKLTCSGDSLRPSLSGCRPICVPVRGDSFTSGGGTVSSCSTLLVNGLTFHNKLIHRDGSISLQLETYKSLLGINYYRLASSLPNN